MSLIKETASEWLKWESLDRPSAWAMLRDVAAQTADRVGARFRLQPADREDLAGDVLFVAIDADCARLRALDDDVSLHAWLFGVARNLALERSRLRATTPLNCDALSATDGVNEPGDADTPAPDRTTRPAKIDRLLRGLTPAQREVELALLSGLSERAIARKLRISRNAVRERVARGRRRLRRGVAESDAEATNSERPPAGARSSSAPESGKSDSPEVTERCEE